MWSADKDYPNFGDDISLLIIRGQNGIELLNTVSHKMKIKKISYNEAVKYNPVQYESVKTVPLRESLFSDISKKNMKQLSDKYIFTDPKSKLKNSSTALVL